MSTGVATLPQTNPSGRTAPHRRVLFWVVALLPFLFLALWRLSDGPGLDADDYGQYLMHAEALAEGRPYSDIGYIHSRYRWGLGPQAAPPGLPVTLAVVYKAVGPNLLAMKLVMLCFATAFVLLAGLYFARHGDRLLGLGVALLAGLSPAIVHGSTQLLTDLPCAALIWAVIYIIDLPGRLDAKRIAAVTLLGGYAMSFRVPGAVILPALILFTILRYREHKLRPLVPILIWMLGVTAVALVTSIARFGVIRFSRIFEWHWAEIVENARVYGSVVLFQSHLHPFPWAGANDVYHVVTGLLMLVGLGAWARTGYNKFGTIFAVVYAGVLLVLPIYGGRYLWPLFPFFVFGLLNGVRVVVQRFLPALRQRASATALAFAGVLVVPGMITALREPPEGDLLETPDMQAITRSLEQDRANGAVRVVFFKPRSFAWKTGIPAMGAIRGPAPCLVSEMARARISHVINQQKADATAQNDVRALTASRPELFREELRTPTFVLYRFAVSPSEAAAAEAACPPRSTYVRSAR
jgi:hypothetical protein